MKYSHLIVFSFFISMPLFVGCAHQKVSKSLQSLDAKDKSGVVLELGKEARKEVTYYYSHAHSKTYEDDQLVRERDEAVSFLLHAKLKRSDSGQLLIDFETSDKDGTVELHDLAFPEPGENLEVVMTPKGIVHKAGTYPEGSLFFVPPISLPERAVNVGDTWQMNTRWISLKNGIPLHLELVSILKELYLCPNGERCADIEISGAVEIGVDLPGVAFASNIHGRLLFSVDKGAVLWSLVRSEEKFKSGPAMVEVSSCLNSLLVEPTESSLALAKSDCDYQTRATELPLR